MKLWDEIAQHCIKGANACDEHRPGVEVADVVRVLWVDEESYQQKLTDHEGNTVCVVELADGRFAKVWEGEDYTGHGCRCEGGASFFDTEEEARRLGIGREQT
jgi:hypothetical protein